MGSSSRAEPEREKPSFFKVLVDDFETKLEIPKGCMESLGWVAPGEVKLRTEKGTWTVTINKSNNLFNGHGWVSFVKDNGFTKGDFLVFSFGGHPIVDVMAFGKTSCFFEKKPKIADLKVAPISPHFEVTFKRFNLFGLFVPAEFAAMTGMWRRKTVVVRDWEGRAWPVKVGPDSSGQLRFGDGWSDCVKQNGLQVGIKFLIQCVLVDDEDGHDDLVLQMSLL